MNSIILKPWLILTGIFAIGAVTGSAVTFTVAPHLFPPRGEAQLREHWLPFLNQKLNLTPEQRDKIKPIVSRAASELTKLHGEEIEHGSKIFHDANEQILQVLTPEQKEILKTIEHEHELQRMRDMGQPFFQPPRGNRGMIRRSGPDSGPPPGLEGMTPMGNPPMGNPRDFGNPPPPRDDDTPPPPRDNPPPKNQ